MKKKIMILLLALFAMVPVTNAEIKSGADLWNAVNESNKRQELEREAQRRAEKEEMKNDIMFGVIVFVFVAGGIFLLARGVRNRKDININSKKDVHIHND